MRNCHIISNKHLLQVYSIKRENVSVSAVVRDEVLIIDAYELHGKISACIYDYKSIYA